MTIFDWFQRRSRKKKSKQPPLPIPDQYMEQHADDPIPNNLEKAVQLFTGLLEDSQFLTVRRFRLFGQFPAAMIYFSNMVDPEIKNADILRPLMYVPDHLAGTRIALKDLSDIVMNDALYYTGSERQQKMGKVILKLLRGGTAVLIDGLNDAIVMETTKIAQRSIDQPETEQVIRGPREGFVEQLGTNISLLRYRLPTTDLKVKTMDLGRVTKSKVAVCYLKGIANDALIQEVFNRLSKIDIDGALDTGYLEQFIEDSHYSPFPQIQNTERTDKAVANLLEGRVIILMDGSPFALILPTTFSQFYQTTEDYNERFLMVSFVRLARLQALVFSLITPSLYVAIISYNPELIPTEFAVAVSGGRAGVPFPSVVEVLVMEASMEMLREATLRLPQQIGGALSIVGVLVVGQAAVAAGFVSPITVVVIALTTIGSFATPAYNAALALRLLRFPLVGMASMFGLYGVMVGLILIANHVLSLRSFGVPYLTPIVPGNFQGMKDTLLRFPLWSMKRRPTLLHTDNDRRLGKDVDNQMKRPTNNTLDPLKVGNEKEDAEGGISPSDHGDTSGGDHH